MLHRLLSSLRPASRERGDVANAIIIGFLAITATVFIGLMAYLLINADPDGRGDASRNTSATSLEELQSIVEVLDSESNNFTISLDNTEHSVQLQGFGNEVPNRDGYCVTVRGEDDSAFYTSSSPDTFVSGQAQEAYVCE